MKILMNQELSSIKSLINDKEFTKLIKEYSLIVRREMVVHLGKFQAEKIKHDKKNKIIHYENAKFYIYDFPVLYFPKIFSP